MPVPVALTPAHRAEPQTGREAALANNDRHGRGGCRSRVMVGKFSGRFHDVSQSTVASPNRNPRRIVLTPATIGRPPDQKGTIAVPSICNVNSLMRYILTRVGDTGFPPTGVPLKVLGWLSIRHSASRACSWPAALLLTRRICTDI
jgi:hypothetical protein